LRKLNLVSYVSFAFMVAVISIGAAPASTAQEQLSVAPTVAAAAATALPGVMVSEVHEGHLHYGLAAPPQDDPNVTVDPKFFSHLSYRPTGFNRGGRATAVTGLPDEPFTFFAGYSGGGVWKTTDAGTSWQNVSDGYFNVGSIGDIKVAPSDPNVIWVGTGSGCPRGNISTGDGIYRSTDGGKTWAHVWSPGFVQVPEMVVHPEDPDHLYAAVLGDIYGPGEVRGIYETNDGGQSWDQLLFISEDTGFNDIEMDPSNPRILYAGAWTVFRKPWSIHSGSAEGGIFRSKDAGATWEKLEGGLPTGMVGKIDVTVSPPNPDRLWAQVEAANDRGGVFRSDNGGDSWTRVNDQRMLQQRAWYYTHIFADPVDPDTVYALNTGAYKSTDGGRTFDFRLSPGHGDNHDLWLNPNNPEILVNSNDGGANVSLNGGRTFSTVNNQPTAEFYRVTVDDGIPYKVYGAQQDNSTAAMNAAFGGGRGRGGSNFYSVGGGESGHIAVDPRDSNVIWAGSYGGNFTRMDRNTGLTRSVRIYADSETGQQAADMKYRFQWNAPIRISPHDPDTVYITSQYVHRTRDAGVNWAVISPDLTTNDITKQGYSGGEGITRDNTGVEVYTTVFAFEESPLTAGLLWAGSDDGLVHISRDDGVTWENITPPNMVEGGTVNQIDMSVHDPGRAHVAVYKYREQDFRPYVYQTNDYGATWTLLTDGANGIPDNHFVRTVREDPNRRGLLFAGTEFGMYVSFDDGAHWQTFQLNLPVTPVTDMIFKNGDLVISTQGRAFWVLDNMTSLSQLDVTSDVPAYLFAPRTAHRGGGNGPEIDFYIAEGTTGQVTLEIANSAGEVVNSRSGRVTAAGPGAQFGGGGRGGFGGGRGGRGGRGGFGGGGGNRLVAREGMNSVSWNGGWPSLYTVPQGIVQWGGGRGGGLSAAPGVYTVTLTVGDWSQSQTLDYLSDPRLDIAQADYDEQVRFAHEVGAEAARLYDELAQLRSVKEQATRIGTSLAEAGYGNDATQAARAMIRKLEEVEGELTQLQGTGGQDALNFPGRLDNQLNALYSQVSGGNPPVQGGAYERWEDIKGELQPHIDAIHAIYADDLEAFNEIAGENGMRVVMRRQQ
jgi:photosystem II stability/assembly factor-like uncharacterized protein